MNDEGPDFLVIGEFEYPRGTLVYEMQLIENRLAAMPWWARFVFRAKIREMRALARDVARRRDEAVEAWLRDPR